MAKGKTIGTDSADDMLAPNKYKSEENVLEGEDNAAALMKMTFEKKQNPYLKNSEGYRFNERASWEIPGYHSCDVSVKKIPSFLAQGYEFHPRTKDIYQNIDLNQVKGDVPGMRTDSRGESTVYMYIPQEWYEQNQEKELAKTTGRRERMLNPELANKGYEQPSSDGLRGVTEKTKVHSVVKRTL